MINLGLWVVEEAPEIQCPSHHIISRSRTAKVTYHCWHWLSSPGLAVSVPFLCYTVTLFPSFPYCSFWKEVAVCSPHYRSRDLCSHSLWTQHLHTLLGIPSLGRFFPFPPIIYLFSNFFTSVQAHGYLLSTLRYSPAWLYLLVHIVPGLAIRSSVSWLVSFWHAAIIVRCAFVFVSVFISFLVLFVCASPPPSRTHTQRAACPCDVWDLRGIVSGFLEIPSKQWGV